MDTPSSSRPAPPDLETLDRYLVDEIPSAERALVERYLQDQPAYAEFVNELRTLRAAEWSGEAPPNVEAALRRVLRNDESAARTSEASTRESQVVPALSRASQPVSSSRSDRTPRYLTLITTVAAAALLVIGFGLWRERSGGNAGGSGGLSQMAVIEYATQKGQRSTVTLADGTIVLLNVASRIRVPRDFGVSTRTLALDGEARFSVAHQTGLPLRIEAAGVTTTVLGTVFGIRAYPGEAHAHVAVASGKVMVRSRTIAVPQEVVLAANEAAVVLPGQGPVVQSGIRLDSYFGWITGQLVFDRTPVQQVLTELSRWYDLDFQLMDSTLAKQRVTATFNLGAHISPADVLHGLAAALDSRLIQNGRTVIFVPASTIETNSSSPSLR